MNLRLTLTCVTALAALSIASVASANLIGPRLGASSDPDQIVFGGQMVVEDMAPNLNFSPNIELGLGDNITTIALNADFVYMFRISGSSWRPYAGGGLGFAFYSFDNDGPGDDSDTGVGVNLIGGAAVPTKAGNQFFLELRVGLFDDLPDFKGMVGWNFGM